MNIRPIKTQQDYHNALIRFEEIFLAEQGTSQSDEADILALLIDDYENKHFSYRKPRSY